VHTRLQGVVQRAPIARQGNTQKAVQIALQESARLVPLVALVRQLNFCRAAQGQARANAKTAKSAVLVHFWKGAQGFCQDRAPAVHHTAPPLRAVHL